MTRLSKQLRERARSPRKHTRWVLPVATGPKRDQLPLGYKPHENALTGEAQVFIAKVK